MNDFVQHLLNWYSINKRDLPWRKTKNPYYIWISEIIFQQTRIEQGLLYYENFIKHFPDVITLSRASLDNILSVWKGLGYYRRAVNLHIAAKQIVEQYNKELPRTFNEWLKIKGVGSYTAAAIASITTGEKCVAIDGNVMRLVSRLLMLKYPKNSKSLKLAIENFLRPQVEADNIDMGDVNQAMMDFASLMCTPKKPQCNKCIFNNYCLSYQNSTVEKYPVVEKKIKKQTIYINYVSIVNQDGIFLIYRTNNIWKNMYDFPAIIANEIIKEPSGVLKKLPFMQDEISQFQYVSTTTIIKHLLTHRIIYAIAHIYYYPQKQLSNLIFVNFSEINKYPYSNLFKKILNEITTITMALKQNN